MDYMDPGVRNPQKVVKLNRSLTHSLLECRAEPIFPVASFTSRDYLSHHQINFNAWIDTVYYIYVRLWEIMTHPCSKFSSDYAKIYSKSRFCVKSPGPVCPTIRNFISGTCWCQSCTYCSHGLTAIYRFNTDHKQRSLQYCSSICQWSSFH